MNLFTAQTAEARNAPLVVVRLSTNNYVHKGRAVISRSITVLKRQSTMSLGDIGVDDDTLPYIEGMSGLTGLPDGVYELKVINESYDYETGFCDDWSYGLFRLQEN